MGSYRERIELENQMAKVEAATPSIKEVYTSRSESFIEKYEKAAEISLLIESLNIPQALQEIRSEIWRERGSINFKAPPYGDYRKGWELSHFIYTSVREKADFKYKEVYGKYTRSVSSCGTGGCTSYPAQEHTGWHRRAIGKTVTGYEYDGYKDEIQVGYSLSSSQKGRIFGDVTVRDSRPFSNMKPNIYVHHPERHDPFFKVEKKFDEDNFSLDSIKFFIDQTLVSSSIGRLDVEEYYLKAEKEIARIEALKGVYIPFSDSVDPTPWWRRIL